ncbi:MAG: Gfo/Idh/MocA family protein, partial [Chloroflexota bacterium]
MSESPIRWGILSTANIVASAFLPGLRSAGGGAPAVVGSRDLERARSYAEKHDIPRAVKGYQAVLDDDSVDAVYIPLPNSLHAEWTVAALEAGKAVLSEKPLTGNVADAQRVLAVAHDSSGLLWEAFAFQFRKQSEQLERIVSQGEIGAVREVQATFHFQIGREDDVRLSSELEGGALLDVGCYCVRLARFVFRSDPSEAIAVAGWSRSGVDENMAGVLTFPGDRRLIMSCGIRRWVDRLARVIGAKGEVTLTNPYHPGPGDTLTVLHSDGTEADLSTANEGASFQG